PASVAPATLTLHDALPILILADVDLDPLLAGPAGVHDETHATLRPDRSLGMKSNRPAPAGRERMIVQQMVGYGNERERATSGRGDRQSTRLNSSHVKTSYA